jgi:hypothetical protein
MITYYYITFILTIDSMNFSFYKKKNRITNGVSNKSIKENKKLSIPFISKE